MKYRIEIVDYDPAWPDRFDEEKQRLLDALGDTVCTVEHIGSTAVPGLGAKPVLDIAVAVERLADAEQCIPFMERLGYEYVSEYEEQLPERRYFRKGPPGGRTHHLHMAERSSDFWRRHLLFRDYLRDHPQTADAYYRLKRYLAATFDAGDYTDAKSSFIEAVIELAERGETGEVEFRRAIRGILLTPDGEVLMIEIRDPDNEWRGWIMPGGGIEEGEALQDCLKREIEEETGLKNALIGPQVWTRLHTFDWTSRMMTQNEEFFLVKTDRYDPDMSANPDPLEQSFSQRMRWWTLDEIESSDEVFVPRILAKLLRQIIETGPPDAPFDCGV